MKAARSSLRDDTTGGIMLMALFLGIFLIAFGVYSIAMLDGLVFVEAYFVLGGLGFIAGGVWYAFYTKAFRKP